MKVQIREVVHCRKGRGIRKHPSELSHLAMDFKRLLSRVTGTKESSIASEEKALAALLDATVLQPETVLLTPSLLHLLNGYLKATIMEVQIAMKENSIPCSFDASLSSIMSLAETTSLGISRQKEKLKIFAFVQSVRTLIIEPKNFKLESAISIDLAYFDNLAELSLIRVEETQVCGMLGLKQKVRPKESIIRPHSSCH